MKKLYTLSLALLVSLASFARIGISGGLTSTSTNLNDAARDLTTKNINLYHVGVEYKLAFGDFFALQPGIVYNVKGASIADFNIDNINFKTGFLEVPVQIQLGFPIGKELRIYGIAEPFAGYAITNTVQHEGLKTSTWENIRNRFEYGVSAGGGIELFSRIQITVRYFWNLGNVYGETFTIKDLSRQINNSNCGGITLSAVLFLF